MVKPKIIEIVEYVNLIITCHICNKDITVALPKLEYQDYFIRGRHAQEALKTQSPEVRELCISGTCGKCFDEMFKEEE